MKARLRIRTHHVYFSYPKGFVLTLLDHLSMPVYTLVWFNEFIAKELMGIDDGGWFAGEVGKGVEEFGIVGR